MKLSELKHLKYLSGFKPLAYLVVIGVFIYLMVKDPKYKTTLEIQLDKKVDTTTVVDTTK
jgi:uncharacterized protein involved in exopolysaccharide biosynthesis